MVRFASATLFMLAVAPACAASDPTTKAEEIEAPSPAAKTESAVTNSSLPVNQRFRSLDAYLLYLQNVEGPSDGVWFKQIRPGVYEMQTNARKILKEGEAPEKRIFTREELMKKFGFSK